MPIRGHVQIEWEDSPKLRALQALIDEEQEWLVVFEAYHAAFVEFGTGPHKPPFKVIHEWVERKLGVKGAHGYALAKAIQLKIMMVGTEAQPFARPAVYDAKAHLAELLEEELSLATVAEFIKSQAQYYIEINGTTDQGTLHRMISIVRVK